MPYRVREPLAAILNDRLVRHIGCGYCRNSHSPVLPSTLRRFIGSDRLRIAEGSHQHALPADIVIFEQMSSHTGRPCSRKSPVASVALYQPRSERRRVRVPFDAEEMGRETLVERFNGAVEKTAAGLAQVGTRGSE